MKMAVMNGPMTRIHRAVREYFKYEFRIASNQPRYVVPRQIAMYLSYKMILRSSLPSIGKYYCGMHHTSALYAINQIERQMRVDEKLKAVVDAIRTRIRADGPLNLDVPACRSSVIESAWNAAQMERV